MMELTGLLKLSQHSFVLSSPIHLFESACADFMMLCICIFKKKNDCDDEGYDRGQYYMN